MFSDVISQNYEKSSKKHCWTKAPSPKQKAYNTCIIFNFFCGEHVSATKKHLKNEGKMMSERHPLNHQKVKKTIGFIVFRRKWQRRKLMKIYAKTMKTQNTKNLIKPNVFNFFLLKKQGSRDGPGTPGPWLPETILNWKTSTKVDFLIKPNVKKNSKTINGHQIMSIIVPRFYSFWLPRNHERLDAFSPYKRRNHYKTSRFLRFIRNDPRRTKTKHCISKIQKT